MSPAPDSRLQRVQADAPAEQVVDALLQDGAVIVEDLLSRDVVSAIKGEVQPFVDLADPDMRHLNAGVQFFHAQTRRMSRPAWNLGDGPRCVDYAATSLLES